MSITLASVLPYLLVAGGYVLRHFQVGSRLLSFVGIAAGPNVLASPATPPALPSVINGTAHPILSDAVNAAIKQVTADTVAGHIASLKDELKAVVQASVAAVVADLKAKA